MTEFNRAKYHEISILMRGEAAMHLNKRYLTFTRSLLEEMGCPPYVRFLVSANDRELALQACKPTDENAYKFSQPKGLQKKAKYCSSAPIKESIFAIISDMWDGNGFFGCRGTYFSEQKAMVFDLNKLYMRNVEAFQRKRV